MGSAQMRIWVTFKVIPLRGQSFAGTRTHQGIVLGNYCRPRHLPLTSQGAYLRFRLGRSTCETRHHAASGSVATALTKNRKFSSQQLAGGEASARLFIGRLRDHPRRETARRGLYSLVLASDWRELTCLLMMNYASEFLR
jgi:hypothetical protein